jgi:hypothetical protein
VRCADFILLRWRVLAICNGVQAFFVNRKRDFLFIIAGGSVVGLYTWFWVQAILRQTTTMLSQNWPAVAGVLAVVAFGGGLMSGFRAARNSLKSLASPWLSVLPWPRSGQRRAAITLVCVMAVAWIVVVWLGFWLCLAQTAIAGAFAFSMEFAALFLAGMAGAAAMIMARPLRSLSVADPPPCRLVRARLDEVIGYVDHASPRWAGLWAITLRLGFVAILWIVSLVVLGAAGAAASLKLHTVLPLLTTGIIGGNISFITSFRCEPLTSAVLRTQPLGYFRAWIAMIRLPLILSFIWFLLPALAALAILGGGLPPVLVAASLLFSLNILFAATAASLPYSPRLAIVFYIIALAWAAYEYGALRSLVFFILTGIMLLSWMRARHRFRSYG